MFPGGLTGGNKQRAEGTQTGLLPFMDHWIKDCCQIGEKDNVRSGWQFTPTRDVTYIIQEAEEDEGICIDRKQEQVKNQDINKKALQKVHKHHIQTMVVNGSPYSLT